MYDPRKVMTKFMWFLAGVNAALGFVVVLRHILEGPRKAWG